VFIDEKGRRTIAVKAVDWFDGLPMSNRNALAARMMLFVPGLTSTHTDPIHMFLAIDQSEETMRYDKTKFNQDIMIQAMLKLADHSFAIVPPDKVSNTCPQLYMRIRSNTMTIDKHAATKWSGQTGGLKEDWASVCRVCTARAFNCNDLANHIHLHFPVDHLKAHMAGKELAKRVKKHLKCGDKDVAADIKNYVDDMSTVGDVANNRTAFIKAWKARGRGKKLRTRTKAVNGFINQRAHSVFGGVRKVPPIYANPLAESLRSRSKMFNGNLHTTTGVLKTSYGVLSKTCMSPWDNDKQREVKSKRTQTREAFMISILEQLGIKPPGKNFSCGRTWREFFGKSPYLLRVDGRPSKLTAIGIVLWRLCSQLTYLFNHFDGSDPSATVSGLVFAVTHAIHHINEALLPGCTTDDHRNHNHYAYAHAATDFIERGQRPMVDTAEDSLEAANKIDKQQAKKLDWRRKVVNEIDGVSSLDYTNSLLEIHSHIWITKQSSELFSQSKRSPDKKKSDVPMQMTENLILCPATLTGTHIDTHIRDIYIPPTSHPNPSESIRIRIHPNPSASASASI
jgi:hypothetical protein